MSTKSAAKLWPKSLNSMTTLLRKSKNFADVARNYSFWSESYYQVWVALLPSDVALTPYELKLMLYPKLVASGYIRSPWYHMTEGLKKSEHRSHKDFQTRTMPGGGNLWYKDPMYLELYSSFCRVLKYAIDIHEKGAKFPVERTSEAIIGEPLPEKRENYLDICQKIPKNPNWTPARFVTKIRF